MKEVVILSGKGGTGKTAVTGALAHLAGTDPRLARLVLVDADVDAANLEILLTPSDTRKWEFMGGVEACIHADLCTACGTCQDVCRFQALDFDENRGVFRVDPLSCEGCAACFYMCPDRAVEMVPRLAGHWLRSDTPFGPLLHARLLPAQENSGKLVALVKGKGREEASSESEESLILVDGPPGIGCPAIAASSGADLVLIVAEPTMAGLHDMARALELAEHFRIDAKVVVNKADLHPAGAEAVEKECAERGIEVLGRIPYDEAVVAGMVQRRPVTEYAPESPAGAALRTIWDRILGGLEATGLPLAPAELVQLEVPSEP